MNSPGRSPFGLIFLMFPTKKPGIMLIVAGGNPGFIVYFFKNVDRSFLEH